MDTRTTLLVSLIVIHGVCAVPAFVGEVYRHSSDVQEAAANNKIGSVHHYSVEPLELSINALSEKAFQQAEMCDCRAEVFDHTGFHGRQLTIIQQNSDFNNDFFNDRVDSIRSFGTCRWLFYEHNNFVGRTHVLNVGYYSSAPSWGGHGNRISSARVLPKEGTVAIALFQHTNYQGRMLILTGSNDHLPNIDFNDAVSSIIVLNGNWQVYEHSQFNGRSFTIKRGEYPDIHSNDIGGDSVSSVKLLGLERALIEKSD